LHQGTFLESLLSKTMLRVALDRDRILHACIAPFFCLLSLPSHSPPPLSPPSNPPTALTIYNQDFAVARTTVPLDLKAGINEVLTTSVTSRLEPDSVVLRDPSGRNPVNIVEQNYDAGVVTQQWLLEKYEARRSTSRYVLPDTATLQNGETREVPAQIVSAGTNPLVEFNRHMQFQLPGTPVFPASTDGLLLRPTLRWQIQSARAAGFSAEFAYITRGISWQAAYNVVLPSRPTLPPQSSPTSSAGSQSRTAPAPTSARPPSSSWPAMSPRSGTCVRAS
jgi:hypothetical protein